MTGLAERLIITSGRLCAWLVVCAPVSVVAVIAYAAMQVRDRPADISYVAPIAMTLVIAAVAAAVGGGLGAVLAFASAELGQPRLARVVRMCVAVLRSAPPLVLGWLAWLIIMPTAYSLGAKTQPQTWVLVFAAILVLAALVVPPAFGAVLHALDRVPADTRAAAAASGASRAQVAFQVLVPLVERTLWAAIAMGFARAAGEATAVTLVFVAGAFYQWPLAGVALGTSLAGANAAGTSGDLLSLGQAAAAGLVLTSFGFVAVIIANRFDRRISWA
jgi:phosphate transport system permease protein